MSDYRREKVLRIPLGMIQLNILQAMPDFDLHDMEFSFPDIWGYADQGKFQLAPTDERYIDFVLEVGRDSEGDWGKTRGLYPSEKAKYLPVFRQISDAPNMDAVRLVEFCYYDGCSAPDYYGPVDDPFYEEV